MCVKRTILWGGVPAVLAALAFAATAAGTMSAGGDVLLDACSFGSAEAARAVWKAIGDTPPVGVTEIGGRRVVQLPCAFVDRGDLTVARWQRDLPLDLTGRLGVRIDVHCEDPAAIRSIVLYLIDAEDRRFAETKGTLVHGWNTLSLIKTAPPDADPAASWASIRKLGIEAAPARRANTTLAVANLRLVGPDPMITLTRLPDHDIVDLRQGEIVHGTLQTKRYTLNTRFGPMTFAAEHVVGLRAVHPSGSTVQMLLTDGAVFTGVLVDPTLHLALPIDEVLTTPVNRIRQLAYRISPDKPLHPLPRGPVLYIAGNRIPFEPAEDFRFRLITAHGPVELPASSLARLTAVEDGTGRRRAVLADGSVLLGELPTGILTVTVPLPDGSRHRAQVISSQVQRFQWPRPVEPPADAMVIELDENQRLFGRIDADTLAINTQFGPRDVPVSGIVSMTLSAIDTGMATVDLWGDQILRGRLLDEAVPFAVPSIGVTIQVKADRIRSITSAGVLTTGQFAAKIERLIRQLDSPDESRRRAAYDELLRAGSPAVPVIRDHLGDPSPLIRRSLLDILAEIG